MGLFDCPKGLKRNYENLTLGTSSSSSKLMCQVHDEYWDFGIFFYMIQLEDDLRKIIKDRY